MSLPVVFGAEAEKEFEDALDYYESQRTGLDVEFLDEVLRFLIGLMRIGGKCWPSFPRAVRPDRA